MTPNPTCTCCGVILYRGHVCRPAPVSPPSGSPESPAPRSAVPEPTPATVLEELLTALENAASSGNPVGAARAAVVNHVAALAGPLSVVDETPDAPDGQPWGTHAVDDLTVTGTHVRRGEWITVSDSEYHALCNAVTERDRMRAALAFYAKWEHWDTTRERAAEWATVVHMPRAAADHGTIARCALATGSVPSAVDLAVDPSRSIPPQSAVALSQPPALETDETRRIVGPLLFALTAFLDAEAPEAMLVLEGADDVRFARWHGLLNLTRKTKAALAAEPAARREGGEPDLSADAQAEIDAFTVHLRDHKGGHPDCRFCDERQCSLRNVSGVRCLRRCHSPSEGCTYPASAPVSPPRGSNGARVTAEQIDALDHYVMRSEGEPRCEVSPAGNFLALADVLRLLSAPAHTAAGDVE